MIKLGDMVETGSKKYNLLWLVKRPELNCYGVMVHTVDEETGKGRGWFFGTTGSLKECREYIRKF